MAKFIPGIPIEEQEAAAKYFTLSNLAMLEVVRSNNIHQAYREADDILASECGIGAGEEKRDWDKEVKKAKPGEYVATEWEKVKGKWDLKGW